MASKVEMQRVATFECDAPGCDVSYESLDPDEGDVQPLPRGWVPFRGQVFHNVSHLLEALAMELVTELEVHAVSLELNVDDKGHERSPYGAFGARFDTGWVPAR